MSNIFQTKDLIDSLTINLQGYQNIPVAIFEINATDKECKTMNKTLN